MHKFFNWSNCLKFAGIAAATSLFTLKNKSCKFNLKILLIILVINGCSATANKKRYDLKEKK